MDDVNAIRWLMVATTIHISTANMSSDGILTFSVFGQGIVFYTTGDQVDSLGCSQETVENPVTSR